MGNIVFSTSAIETARSRRAAPPTLPEQDRTLGGGTNIDAPYIGDEPRKPRPPLVTRSTRKALRYRPFVDAAAVAANEPST